MLLSVVLREAAMLLLNFETNLWWEALRINSSRYIARAFPQGDANRTLS